MPWWQWRSFCTSAAYLVINISPFGMVLCQFGVLVKFFTTQSLQTLITFSFVCLYLNCCACNHVAECKRICCFLCESCDQNSALCESPRHSQYHSQVRSWFNTSTFLLQSCHDNPQTFLNTDVSKPLSFYLSLLLTVRVSELWRIIDCASFVQQHFRCFADIFCFPYLIQTSHGSCLFT